MLNVGHALPFGDPVAVWDVLAEMPVLAQLLAELRPDASVDEAWLAHSSADVNVADSRVFKSYPELLSGGAKRPRLRRVEWYDHAPGPAIEFGRLMIASGNATDVVLSVSRPREGWQWFVMFRHSYQERMVDFAAARVVFEVPRSLGRSVYTAVVVDELLATFRRLVSTADAFAGDINATLPGSYHSTDLELVFGHVYSDYARPTTRLRHYGWVEFVPPHLTHLLGGIEHIVANAPVHHAEIIHTPSGAGVILQHTPRPDERTVEQRRELRNFLLPVLITPRGPRICSDDQSAFDVLPEDWDRAIPP